MKKLIMLVAVVAATVCAQAASVAWTLTQNAADWKTGTINVYAFANTTTDALAAICTSDSAAWPDSCRRAAELVRVAPSAMNLQPWMLSWERGCFAVDCAERTQLDLGIALCHAELALRMPHTWDYGRSPREPAAFTQLEA